MVTQTCLKIEDQGEVLQIRLNRPQVRNAFNEALIKELTHVFSKKLGKNPSYRAVVLSGEGKSFSAGGDLNWMKKSVDLSFEENKKDAIRLAQMFEMIRQCPVPVIGLIQGAAFGGGLGIVSVCDYAIASKEALFSFSEVRLGLVPAVITPFVIPKIGRSHAMALFTTGMRFDALRAKEIGLIHEIVNNPEQLNQALQNLLKSILASGPNAVKTAKNIVLNFSNQNQLLDMAEDLAKLRISPEGQEGVRAFLEKRKPNWDQ